MPPDSYTVYIPSSEFYLLTLCPSIKVGCTAYFNKKNYSNGEVEVIYHWKHLNRDPFDIESIVEESRLSPEIKKMD